MPYENSKALDFCIYLKKHYRIPDGNVINLGDEIDQFHGSLYNKDPDAELSPVGEIAITIEKIRQWASHFPEKYVCISNHGLRWLRKATDAQIPSQLLRTYQDMFKIPEGWKYREEWRFEQGFKHPFRAIHGMGYSGVNGHRNAVMDSGISTAIGHLSSFAAVSYIKMMGAERKWALNGGCLIDNDAVAFKYGKYNRPKPCNGAGIIYDSGRVPIWIPLD